MMTTPKLPQEVELIPVDRITVINPRVRNQRQHQEIVDSIKAIGLKRPITVSRRAAEDGQPRYDLVCGQGRLEAFQQLNQVEIPAIVIDAPEEECLLKSLVENVARRQHSPLELMQEISNLRQRGYNDTQIGNKIGVTGSWVSYIAGLLDNGEERLVKSVETGLIPISLAIEISRSDDAQIQAVLADAYTQGILRGKKLAAVRRLLEQRAKSKKGASTTPQSRPAGTKKITAEHLRKVYQQEADRQRLLIKKAEFVETRITFVVQVFKKLLVGSNDFMGLLEAEGLSNIPAQLHAKII
jgi:ParB family chromosome partitioning protein